MTATLPTRDDVRSAADRIAPWVRVTPTLEVKAPGVNAYVHLKLEQLQHTGSFKVRGVFNTLLSLDVPESGVTTASGGNHGAALAFAAEQLGHRCTVFVPSIAPASKLRLIERYGATIEVAGDVYAQSVEAAETYAADTGAVNVHAYAGAPVIAGQGTVAAEFDAQVPGQDLVVAAVGGGGFLGGVAAYYGRDTRLVGVEPEQSPSMYEARAAGGPVDVSTGGVAADSLGCRRVGDLAYGLVEQFVDDLVLVSDAEIQAAQQWLWDECRLLTETGGATALAGLVSGGVQVPAGSRVGVIVCGANTEPSQIEGSG